MSKIPFDSNNTDCSNCVFGVVEREVDDYSDDCGVSYVAINGSSVEYGLPYPTGKLAAEWFCPACTAINVAFMADYGCTIAPQSPPRSERVWRLSFEVDHGDWLAWHRAHASYDAAGA